MGEARGGHDLDDVEGGPGHVVVVEGGEVGELVEGGGFGMGVRGFELAADLVEGLGDEGGFTDELQAEAFDQVLQSALEESLHEGRGAPRHLSFCRKRTPTNQLGLLSE